MTDKDIADMKFLLHGVRRDLERLQVSLNWVHTKLPPTVNSEVGDIPLHMINMSPRVYRRLRDMGLEYMDDVARISAEEFCVRDKIGPNILADLRETLKRCGLHLRGEDWKGE